MSEAPTWDDTGPDTPAETARLRQADRDWPLARSERPSPWESVQRRVRSRAYRAVLPRQAQGLHDTDHTALLDRAGNAAAVLAAAQVERLQTAVDWAALHAAASHGDPSEGGEQLVALAGDGAPLVAEFCIPELALALGVSTDSGRLLMSDALELAHRLPGCWSALLAGGVPVFRARRVARATRDLPAAAAAFVDAEVAPYLHGLGVKALDEVVERAIWRFDLPRALAESAAALDRRGITVDLDIPLSTESGATTGAVVQVYGHLDRADAVELDRALADLAHHLLQAGSTATLEVRRAKALGMLARRETPIAIPDLTPTAEQARAAREEWHDLDEDQPAEAPAVIARRRDVTLHVHLTDEALRTGTGIARLEGCTHPISVAQVREWVQAPGTTTRVTVRPVLDLDAHLTSPGYTPTADLAEQTIQRDRTCVFPHCTRDARRSDLDHVTPYDPDDPDGSGAQTASDNLAALCRRHHRLKTHHPGWTYTVLHPGTYLWTTPHGRQLLRDRRGTHPLRAVVAV